MAKRRRDESPERQALQEMVSGYLKKYNYPDFPNNKCYILYLIPWLNFCFNGYMRLL